MGTRDPIRLDYLRPAANTYDFNSLSLRCAIAAALAGEIGYVLLRLPNNSPVGAFFTVIGGVLEAMMPIAGTCGAVFAARAMRHQTRAKFRAACLLAINLLTAFSIPFFYVYGI